jgi:acetyl esterase/lipase
MPSWPARVLSGYARLLIRRRDWGDARALTRRARRLFGAPPVYRQVVLLGLHCERVTSESGVRGEWIAARGPAPDVLLYVHGGGYVSCSAATHRPVTASLARLVGCRVFAAEYRTAPEAPFPAAFDDVVAVYRWLLTEGAPGVRIAVAGDSAGGGLVLALALHARDAGWLAPACVVALSPWTDLAGTGNSVREHDGRCALFHSENIPAFAAVYLDGAPADDPRASPLYADLSGLPPVLIQVGSTELLWDDARRAHERLVAAGGSSRLTVYEDLMHGWHLMAPLLPEARVALREVASFVRTHLARPEGRPVIADGREDAR